MPSNLLAAPLLTRSASILYLWNRPLSIAPRTSHTHTDTDTSASARLNLRLFAPQLRPRACIEHLISTKQQSAITPGRRASATSTDACSAIQPPRSVAASDPSQIDIDSTMHKVRIREL
ncbi:hypothetical protein H0G86_001475 [Trichoderma simmonsii]|uniref:Uncharacterized protein n=1 Tax=Trichoderma simmonsii TaxID=1491479 RepID=A0A8G0PAI3_9HYPO|nr:hypothetical protein H0G86_001475 [Trichoderma simmonsii]